MYDGRGIRPDVEVNDEEFGLILEGLINKWIIFDWATSYRNNHELIDSISFRLTDADYRNFRDYVLSRDFSYDTNTLEIYRELENAAKQEKYFDEAANEFSRLADRLKPDAGRDLDKFKDRIMDLLENEVVSRYYYQDGRIRQSIPNDPCLRTAREVFSSNYASLLSNPSPQRK